MDPVNLSHSQVTRKPINIASSSSNYHINVRQSHVRFSPLFGSPHTIGDIETRGQLESHDVHLKWTSTHIINEQVVLLAKEDCNAFPNIFSTLTYSEHQSRAKSEILKEWRSPPNHHQHESKHPGSSFLLKCGIASQTAISRLKSVYIKKYFLLWWQRDFCSLS
ncbi:hypothetical protein TNCV_2236331 [Trichonephila clavipes]|nr:hypothetical protein TNCV_2236331 [Trichonephila clavipes]